MNDEMIRSAIHCGVQQLECAVSEMEQAALQIMELSESLIAGLEDEETKARLFDIIQSCWFQDVSGQRMRKVCELLKFLDRNAVGVRPAKPQMPRSVAEPPAGMRALTQKPAAALNQAQIDGHFQTARAWT
ncbi:MAG: hypothetical protein HYR63_06145 [Proteobacteria bacterium]|nr:hypothetical protein [Pseudomonadota bacterium]MBI3495918.1 hypothetical protein [Pseudomonadota bacterium]